MSPADHPPPPFRRNRLIPATGRATAVVYCEGNFGKPDGKTANGLVRHSERYEIVSVIDSAQSGLDAGEVLGGKPSSIPICIDLVDAITSSNQVPDTFIFRDGTVERPAAPGPPRASPA